MEQKALQLPKLLSNNILMSRELAYFQPYH